MVLVQISDLTVLLWGFMKGYTGYKYPMDDRDDEITHFVVDHLDIVSGIYIRNTVVG